MISHSIIQLVDHYGYLIFFLAFCLGPFGIPVPNEITILTGSILSNSGILNPWMIYTHILAGLLTAITCTFFVGKIFGEKLKRKYLNNRHFQKADKFYKQYGNIAMFLGILLPVVRYIVPVFIGLSGITFRKFCLISYSSACVWTAMFFAFGKFFGDYILAGLHLLDSRSITFLIIAVGILIISKGYESEFLKSALLNEPVRE